MDVSIIIVNYRTADLVIDCIHSIFSQNSGVDFEIIVVDNASGDDSAHKIEACFGERIRVIRSPENLGFGKGNNLGAQYAVGRYLFLLNPDTYLLNDAVRILADYMDAHSEVGVAGGNLFFPDGSPAPSFSRSFDVPEREEKQAAWRSIIGGKLREKLGVHKKEAHLATFNDSGEDIPVGYIFGADMMVRHDVFRKLGGFDPDFFMYAEEEELSWRISRAGYRIMSVPRAQIVHLEGASTSTSGGFSERQFRMRMSGKLIYYAKCYGEAGMERFYAARHRRYQRLMQVARWRGKNSKETLAHAMLHCLDDEYVRYKESVLTRGFDHG